MGRKKPAPLNNLVVISDLHSGSAVSLMPREGVVLDDGGLYKPSALQLKIYAMWEEFWGSFVPDATRGEPYGLLVNGDALDGVPHNSVAQVTANMKDQKRIARALLEPVVAKAERYWHVRGTEAHVGKSSAAEEDLAESLGSIPDDRGNYARYDLWLRLGDRLVHALHHVGTTGSTAYEATAVHKELVEELTESARWGEEPPDCIIRSHRHRHIETSIPTRRGRCIAVVSPAWQGKTPFVWKIPGGRLAPPQFGGLVVRHAHGRLFVDAKVWTPARSAVEV